MSSKFVMFQDDLYVYFVPEASEKDFKRLRDADSGSVRLSLFTLSELIILKSDKSVIKSRHF